MKKISDLVDLSKDPVIDDLEEFQFGSVYPFQGQQIAISTGVNIAGARKLINVYGIRHALKRHGNHTLEQLDNQIGLQDSDFNLIPGILSNPDSVQRGTDTNRGNKVLKFIKIINGHTYIVIMTFFLGGRKGPKLEFDTMYIKQ